MGWDISRWDESLWTGEGSPIVNPYTDYNGLIEGVVDTIRDDDVDNNRARAFIALARPMMERDFMRDGSVPFPMAVRGKSQTDQNSGVTLPTTYLRTRNVRFRGQRAIYTPPSAVPSVGPNPDYEGMAVELDFYEKIPDLSDAAPSNWVLALAPDLYLYAACLQYVPWGHEQEVLKLWRTYYQDAVSSAKQSYAIQPRAGMMSAKSRPWQAFYTVTGNQMLFGAQRSAYYG